MIHELKTFPDFFNAVISGKKTFEVRKADRDFRVGDMLALNEYDPEAKVYTRNSCLVYIDYILSNEEYTKSGYVVMSIKPCMVAKYDAPYDSLKMGRDYSVPYATRYETDNQPKRCRS